MHILLTDVAPAGPNCAAALQQLTLPVLDALLARLGPGRRTHGAPAALTPLSEWLRAHALGLPGVGPVASDPSGQDNRPNEGPGDGLLPWAALDAQHLGLPTPVGAGWGWLTPCHWKIHSDHVLMQDPQTLSLDAHEARQLQQAMHGYFAEDGLQLHPYLPGTWLVCGAALRDLPTASLERVSGRRVDTWMGQQPAARMLRRLQNEMQMLLYTHPVNSAREARGLPAVNSFWISGTGSLPANPGAAPAPATDFAHPALPPVCLSPLRAAASADDASAWLDAWLALEQGPLRELLQTALRGTSVQLTLCSADQALTFSSPQAGWWQRLRRRWHPVAARALISTL